MRPRSKRPLSNTQRRIRSFRPANQAQLRYRRLVTERLRRWHAAVREVLLPAIREEFPGVKQDSLSPGIRKALEILELRLTETFPLRGIDGDLQTIGDIVYRHGRQELRRVVGISMASNPAVGPLLAQFRELGVSRIKSLAGEQLVQITQILDAASRTGLHVEALTEQIEERFGVTSSKAELLARDQTLKLNAQVAKAQMQAVGIMQYTWTTSKDERVRGNPSGPKSKLDHWSLDGNVFSFNDPPDVGDGRRCNPGEDFQCRCTASPIVPEALTSNEQ